MKKIIRLLLHTSVIGFCFYLALRATDVKELSQVVSGLDPALFALAMVFQVGLLVVESARWRYMLIQDGVRLPFVELLTISIESSFFATFLPSSLGVEVVRGASIYKHMGGARRVAVNLLGSRIIGLWAITLLALTGILVPAEGYGEVRFWALTSCGLVAVGTAAIVYSPLVKLGHAILLRISQRLAEFHANCAAQFHRYLKRRSNLAILIGLSLVQNVFGVIAVYLACRATGAEAGFLFFLLAMPPVWLLTLVPTIAGIGPKETGLAVLLTSVGVQNDVAVASALTVMSMILAINLAGGVVYLTRRLYRGLRTD